ncbi:adhesion G protein-coupled receptor F5 [Leptodactylus fuscus]|uniref:adhesion G protein-coupled receptor F5 n=1 Tax=Leptodactylus fuscus TaxID=238119 RepID=UPI003F4F0C45
MRLQWIFIFFLVSCWIAPTVEAMGSWDLSSLFSALLHGGHDTESDTVIDKSLLRRKRATAVSHYTVDIEISFPDASLTNQIKQFLAQNLTFPIMLRDNDTEIQSISVTTACSHTNGNVQCSCENGYKWRNEVCKLYQPCPGSINGSCNCISGTGFPSQYCQLIPVSINLSLKILEAFTADFKDSTSETYKRYKATLESQFNNTYQSLSGFRSATLTGFRPGSIIADYTVVTEPVSSTAITDANNNLVANLKAANFSVDSVKTVIKENITLTVSPENIFNKDTFSLTCTVNTFSNLNFSWDLNGTKIPNTSPPTSPVYGTVQSVLTIYMASAINDSGNYTCIAEDSSYSYQATHPVVILPLNFTTLSQNVTCDNTDIPIVQCCTQSTSMDLNLTCKVNEGIQGTVVSNMNQCIVYTVRGNITTCSGSKSGKYDCACFTSNGANETLNVNVTYQATNKATVTSEKGTVSEGKDLSLKCKCDATSVKSISWTLDRVNITNPPANNNLDTCSSTLTIPGNTTTIAWAGNYQCLVDTASGNIVSENKTITIVELPRQNQIVIIPQVQSFMCQNQTDFSCCINNIWKYRASLQMKTVSGKNLQKDMTIKEGCFFLSYVPVEADNTCENFTARCNIINDIFDTVLSNEMHLTFVQDPECQATYPGSSKPEKIYYGKIGFTLSVPCSQDDSSLAGTKYFTCEKSGSGATWVPSTRECVSVALNNIQNQLDSLTSPTSTAQVIEVLGDLRSNVTAIQGSVSTSPNDVSLVVNLLQKVDTFLGSVSQPAMQNFLDTVNVVVDNPTTWKEVKNSAQQSANLLQSVENFAGKLTINGPVNISNSNVQLSGNVISKLTDNYTAIFAFSGKINLTGNVVIDNTTLSTFNSNTTVVSVAYSTLMDILPTSGNNTKVHGEINGLIMTTKVSQNSTKFQIGMDFAKLNTTLNNATCVFWNFNTMNWDNTGCHERPNVDNTTVTCICEHLTSFSILMSSNYNPNPSDEVTLTYITYIGLGISIISLVICIIIEITVWKSVTKNKTSYMRHVCIMNIAVTLLMADIWFIIGSALANTDYTNACVAATFFTHLFYLGTFFWMLTMGLILFYRLMCVFHDLSKTIMMGISFFLGYGCPIIISVITVAVTEPSKTYTVEKKCWLNMTESKAFLAFIIPALSILLVNFITLFVVIIKVLRPSVGDKPKKEEKSSLNHIAKCILILTPLLGLTWGFGIGTMSSPSVVIHGIFAALNGLQGLFILLFGCLMDKKVRDALFSRFSVSRWSSQQTKTSNLSSSDPVFSKGVINLFAKKGVYHISSAQASSSSEMSNSYSLLT